MQFSHSKQSPGSPGSQCSHCHCCQKKNVQTIWSLNITFTQDKAIATTLPKVPDWPVQDGGIVEVGRGMAEPGTWAKMRH